MPNGWYPVPGLDVVLVNRTEQRYPRIEWDQSWERFWAVEIIGPRGFTPQGALRLPAETPGAPMPFERLVSGTAAVLASEPNLQAHGSAVFIDFSRKEGHSVGAFCVYGWKDGKVEVLHDHTLGADLPEGTDLKDHAHVVEICTTMFDKSGLEPQRERGVKYRFEFGGFDALLVSSVALHYDAHWPPKNSLDGVVIALAKKDRRDCLVAIWKAEEPGRT